MFNQQAVQEAFHLYHTLRRKGLTSRAKASDKILKCIMEWMTEDEGGLDIPNFVADNISWWYPVDPKKINCAMLLRENKFLASAIPDLGEQMKKMEQMLRDFCQKYTAINNPQSEVETRIETFLTGVRNAFNMVSAEKLQSSAPSPGAQPASGILPPPTSLASPPALPRIYPHTPPPHTAVPLAPAEPTRPLLQGPSIL